MITYSVVDSRLDYNIPLMLGQHVLEFLNKDVMSMNVGPMSSRADLENMSQVLGTTWSIVVAVTPLMLLTASSHPCSTKECSTLQNNGCTEVMAQH